MVLTRFNTQVYPTPYETIVTYDVMFVLQKHSCAMGFPVSPTVDNLYRDEVESRALNSLPGSTPCHWFGIHG